MRDSDMKRRLNNINNINQKTNRYEFEEHLKQ